MTPAPSRAESCPGGTIPSALRRRSGRLRWFVCLLAVLAVPSMLAACAGAKLSRQEASSASPPPQPAAVAIRVNDPYGTAETAKVARDLGQAVAADFETAGIPAWIALDEIAPSAQTAVLDLRLDRLQEGNALERLVIGFGAGQSSLQIDAMLTVPDATLLSLTSDANSGHKPGLIVPGGAALATGQAIHLAIGGSIGVAANLRGGASQDVKNTAKEITKSVNEYFRSLGWIHWVMADYPINIG